MTTVEVRGGAGGAGVEAVAALPGLSHPAGCNNRALAPQENLWWAKGDVLL